MPKNILKSLAFIMAVSLLTSGVVSAAQATRDHRVETGSHQQVRGIDIYYGVVPTQVTGKHSPTHEEQKMHGGVPAKKDEYHLIVALFDTSGKRITDADVTASVGELGMAGTRKALEPMQISNTTSFGNYFALRKDGIYRIAIEIRRLGKQKPETVEALFDYRLQ